MILKFLGSTEGHSGKGYGSIGAERVGAEGVGARSEGGGSGEEWGREQGEQLPPFQPCLLSSPLNNDNVYSKLILRIYDYFSSFYFLLYKFQF